MNAVYLFSLYNHLCTRNFEASISRICRIGTRCVIRVEEKLPLMLNLWLKSLDEGWRIEAR